MSTVAATTLRSSRPTASLRPGLQSTQQQSTTSTNQYHPNFSFDVSQLWGQVTHRDEDSLGVALAAGFYSSYYNHYIQAQNQQLENAYGSAYNATVPNGPTVQQPVNPGTGITSSIPSSSLNAAKTAYKAPVSTQASYQNYYQYVPNFSSTEVIEAFYNIQLNKWASFKPSVQYIINPAGNGTIGNDLILGVSAKVIF